MTFEELNEATIRWAEDKGIFDKSNEYHQFEKTLEEVNEVALELSHRAHGVSDNLQDIESEVGDVVVTLVLMTKFLDLDLTKCLEVAYTKISKRKGKMISGKFVKEEDLPK